VQHPCQEADPAVSACARRRSTHERGPRRRLRRRRIEPGRRDLLGRRWRGHHDGWRKNPGGAQVVAVHPRQWRAQLPRPQRPGRGPVGLKAPGSTPPRRSSRAPSRSAPGTHQTKASRPAPGSRSILRGFARVLAVHALARRARLPRPDGHPLGWHHGCRLSRRGAKRPRSLAGLPAGQIECRSLLPGLLPSTIGRK
jgi:hypothetical protein